jgi:molybdate transport system substrate-binding protein
MERNMRLKHIGVIAALVATELVVSAPTNAAEIKVLASPAVKEAYTELVPTFERASGHSVTTNWAGTVDILKRIRAGEIFDLVIATDASINALTKEGRIVAGSRVDLARAGIGAAVRSGARKPDISTVDALKRTLLAANSIGYSTGPSGLYLTGLFERMGIAEELKPKLKTTRPGASIGEMVARGEVEIGFQAIAELLPVKGIEFVGPLPQEVQHLTVFSSGIHISATDIDAVKSLVNSFTSPSAATIIRKTGMDPG